MSPNTSSACRGRSDGHPSLLLEGLTVIAIEQAVAASPGDLDLKMAYGRELRDQHRYADAAHQFASVAQAKPDSVEAWNELSGMLVSLEQFPQALAALDRVKALGGETPGHLYVRAIVLDRLKDVKGALDNYQKFLAGSGGKQQQDEKQKFDQEAQGNSSATGGSCPCQTSR